MELYLVQHGACKSKEEDPERSLTEAGKGKITALCELAKKFPIEPTAIHHSTKKRAKETAHLIAQKLELAVEPIEVAGLAPMDDVKSYWQSIKDADGLMVVGHLPFLSKLAAFLVAGDEDGKVISFSQGAINKLVSDDGERWSIELILPAL